MRRETPGNNPGSSKMESKRQKIDAPAKFRGTKFMRQNVIAPRDGTRGAKGLGDSLGKGINQNTDISNCFAVPILSRGIDYILTLEFLWKITGKFLGHQILDA